MPRYKEDFPIGTTVRIADRPFLEEFQRIWRYHDNIEPVQLDYAGKTAVVAKVGFYHGGDVLYDLRDIPGTWHEHCLRQAPQC